MDILEDAVHRLYTVHEGIHVQQESFSRDLRRLAVRPHPIFDGGGHGVPPLHRSTPKQHGTGTGCACLGFILVCWRERRTEADGTIHHVDYTRCKLWRNAADIPLSK
jgi:hypothetical protein